MSNCSTSSNACIPCSNNCPKGYYNGECVYYTGTAISGLTYSEDSTLDQMIYAIGMKAVAAYTLAGGAFMYVYSETVAFGDLNTLPATPVVLIPAVTGKTIVPVSFTWEYAHNSVDFTNSAGAYIRYTGTTISLSSVNSSFAATSNHISITPCSAVTNQNPAATEGVSVELATSGTFSGGNGSITITIVYYLF